MATTKPVLRPLILEPIHHSVVHYYDEHPTEEDLMGESIAQSTTMSYLEAVLSWYAWGTTWFIASNFNMYRDPDRMAYPIAPDLAIFKEVTLSEDERVTLQSWRLYRPDNPPPEVVFEICSDSTWKKDVNEKPAKYADMGVREYYAYDPNTPPLWTGKHGRLRGWHRVGSAWVEQSADAQGRIWSPELTSWLVPDGVLLRLYDVDGVCRQTEGEAERAAREWEAQRAEAERAAKERETQRAEAERAAKEAAWAKLIELGIDPTTLGNEKQ